MEITNWQKAGRESVFKKVYSFFTAFNRSSSQVIICFSDTDGKKLSITMEKDEAKKIVKELTHYFKLNAL